MSAIEAAADEARKVVAKQQVAQREAEKTIQRLISLVEAAKARIDGGDGAEEEVLAKLNEQVLKELKGAVGQTKELHSSVGKLGKVGVYRAR